MLSTLARWLLPDDTALPVYETTHFNHPCNRWLRKSIQNAHWLAQLTIQLNARFHAQTQRIHGSMDVFALCEAVLFEFETGEHKPASRRHQAFMTAPGTPPAQAMPAECKHDNPAVAYRRYAIEHKAHLYSRDRVVPAWFEKRDPFVGLE